MTTCSQSDCVRLPVGRGLCSLHYQRYRYQGRLDEVAPEPSEKRCAQCDESFEPKFRRWGAIYCSKRCDDNARRARQRAEKGRQADSCDHCGASLAGKRTDARFCSAACGLSWRNAQRAEAARLAKLDNRKPCVGCGGEIPPEVRGNALYCSRQCKIASRRHEAYGLTKQELDLLLSQNECCAICGTNEWGRKGPQVDHCHATGRVRGILCTSCNNGLGRFRDRSEFLGAAISYLEAPIVDGEAKVVVSAEDIGLIEDGAEGESRRWWCRICHHHGPDAENDAEAWQQFASEHVPGVHG